MGTKSKSTLTTAVRAVPETLNPTDKHARWWMRVYGKGVKELQIVYRVGKDNKSADTLSRAPRDPTSPPSDLEVWPYSLIEAPTFCPA